ncbi:unnamed protein product [Urochloa humidicola]
MVMVSPLHRVIDAVRWDAERLLGRLIVVVHAAFLDAGFVPLPHDPRSRKPCTVPKQAGRTSSSELSLRYAAPQPLHHRQGAAAAALRILAHGRRHLILYVACDGPWPVEHCAVVDALAAAPLLAGGLDATARALRRDAAPAAALWRLLADGLCRRALVDICRRSGVDAALEPTFASLPDDAMAAVLSRLADGADLARAELACAALRRVVAVRDRELWKPRHDALVARRAATPWLLPVPGDDDGCCGGGHSPETSWKERYVAARRVSANPPPPASSRLGIPGDAVVVASFHCSPLSIDRGDVWYIGMMLNRRWQHTRSASEGTGFCWPGEASEPQGEGEAGRRHRLVFRRIAGAAPPVQSTSCLLGTDGNNSDRPADGRAYYVVGIASEFRAV